MITQYFFDHQHGTWKESLLVCHAKDTDHAIGQFKNWARVHTHPMPVLISRLDANNRFEDVGHV